MEDVQMFSGGLGSWASAKRRTQQTGKPPCLLFADTIIEDEDLYRFIVQGAANILGAATGWQALEPMWKSIPPLEQMPDRKLHLQAFAVAAMQAIPGLVWIRDGRTPWEVFHDVRFVGNTMVAKCSHTLKQATCRVWLETNRDVADTTLILGIDWQEGHRYEGKKGVNGKPDTPGARELWLPWQSVAPMCDAPHLSKYEVANWLEREGIDPPRLYDLGFTHNNCGGFCVKAGHAHFRRLLATMPDRYAYHESQEEYLRRYLDKDVAILRNRKGGTTKPLPMVDFRRQQEAGQQCDMLDFGGCGCFSDPGVE